MYKLQRFQDFKRIDEKLTTKDAKSAIKDIFKKFDGEVTDKYLKEIWEKDSTLRNLYSKELFDKSWDELIDAGEIKTEDGKNWCWCEMVEESVNEKLDGEELLSPKQRKLPEGLKKAIINRMKKQKPKKEEKEDKKEDKKKTGTDEEKYLTPKQRKLPEGLKKGIIARAKKK